ncbi:hypothetical protein AG1IA_10066 [Rhizoctonia solani AG-1 IA]|uniref:Uncharacterized protein n=1 Tax=Thanatephorus cucumeris (strain AG1-IA) TaxID=983506 RepID=L8WHQ4_THACA|nr:hypothetical protein AG1IA_10066 [Rhizoctonia solani AG-1 IA]
MENVYFGSYSTDCFPGARAYKECSALNNQGVDDVFEAATRASMIVREVKSEAGEEHSGGCGCVLC